MAEGATGQAEEAKEDDQPEGQALSTCVGRDVSLRFSSSASPDLDCFVPAGRHNHVGICRVVLDGKDAVCVTDQLRSTIDAHIALTARSRTAGMRCARGSDWRHRPRLLWRGLADLQRRQSPPLSPGRRGERPHRSQRLQPEDVKCIVDGGMKMREYSSWVRVPSGNGGCLRT
jgi:hypothetical protein